MADKQRYIAEYRMPVGFDNPPVNIPHANTPTPLSLTKAEAKQLKKMLPDIKLVRAKDQDSSPEAEIASLSDEEDDTEATAQTEEEDSAGQGPEGTDEDAGAETKPEDETEEETDEEQEDAAQDEETEEPSEDEAEDSEEDLHYLEDDEDFPGKDKLLEHSDDTYPGGLVTVEAVVAFSKENNLSDIDGIGDKRSDKIVDYLMENYSELLDE